MTAQLEQMQSDLRSLQMKKSGILYKDKEFYHHLRIPESQQMLAQQKTCLFFFSENQSLRNTCVTDISKPLKLFSLATNCKKS